MRELTPQPGFTEEDVQELIHSRQFVFADCFTIEPLVGDDLLYTTAQRSISVVPVGEIERKIYKAGGLLIKGLRVRMTIGIEVDEQEIELDYDNEVQYQAALTWPQALLQGRLDGASIRRDRYFAKTWGNGPAQTTIWVGGTTTFLGLVSTLDRVGRQSASVSVRSNLVGLNRQAPVSLWTSNCKNTWGDAGCGVAQGEWAVPGVVGADPTRTVLPWAGASDEYSQGKIHISNGDDVTRVRTINKATSTHLYLSYPIDFDPWVGLEFIAYPGCSRTDDPTYGCPKYHGDPGWKSRFKGFPFIPKAETAL